MEINLAIEDHTLVGHVFKSMLIQDSSVCEVNCFMEGDCVSFNFKLQQDGKYLCNLSDSDHVVHPGDLKGEQGAVFTSFKVREIRLASLFLPLFSNASLASV